MAAPEPGRCKTCLAEVYWIRSAKTGTPMIADRRRLTVITDEGRVVSGYQSHFASCPDADEHRSKS